MADSKGAGTTKNGRDSAGRRLGLKISGGSFAKAGNIIIRQRGSVYHAGVGTGMGRDHTIFSINSGIVSFRHGKNDRTFVDISPCQEK